MTISVNNHTLFNSNELASKHSFKLFLGVLQAGPHFRKFSSYHASCLLLVPPLHPGWPFHHSTVGSPGNSCSFTGPHLPETTLPPTITPGTKPFIIVTIMTSGSRTYSHHSRYCLFLLLIMCILKSLIGAYLKSPHAFIFSKSKLLAYGLL